MVEQSWNLKHGWWWGALLSCVLSAFLGYLIPNEREQMLSTELETAKQEIATLNQAASEFQAEIVRLTTERDAALERVSELNSSLTRVKSQRSMASELYRDERERANALQAEKDARARLGQRVGSLGTRYHVYQNPPPGSVSPHGTVAFSVAPNDEWAARVRWEVQDTRYCRIAGGDLGSVFRLQGGGWITSCTVLVRHDTWRSGVEIVVQFR